MARSRSISAFSKGRGRRKEGMPDRQHSARSGERFENSRTVTLLPELVCTDQSGRARTNDGNFLRTVGDRGLRQLVVGKLVRDKALQRRKIQRIVHSGTSTRGGAGVGANPAAD